MLYTQKGRYRVLRFTLLTTYCHCQIALQNVLTSFHFHQQHKRTSTSSHCVLDIPWITHPVYPTCASFVSQIDSQSPLCSVNLCVCSHVWTCASMCSCLWEHVLSYIVNVCMCIHVHVYMCEFRCMHFVCLCECVQMWWASCSQGSSQGRKLSRYHSLR